MSTPAFKSSVLIHTNGASNTTHDGYVDTRGYNFVTIDCIGRTEASTATGPAVLNVYDNDTTSIDTATTYLLVTGSTDFTMRALTASIASTGSLRSVNKIDIDMRGRRRFLHVRHTASTVAATSEMTVIANLTNSEITPLSSTQTDGAGHYAI